jgi:hypothetical protein
MGVAIGDYDRDGRLDYFNSNIGDPTLYHNAGAYFDYATFGAGLDIGHHPETQRLQWTWGANFFDCDMDGWLDLYVCAGANRWLGDLQPNVLCFNNGDGTFSRRTDLGAAADPDRSRTSVAGDYDGDGDLDLYVVNYQQPAHLYRNDNESGHHYLGVRLRGVSSNRDGIGARLRLPMPDGTCQYQEVRSGSSLGGGDDIVVRFGLGRETTARELFIRWPSGIVQRVSNLPADVVHVVEEPNHGIAEVAELSAAARVRGAIVRWSARFEHRVVRFVVEHETESGFTGIDSVDGQGTTFVPVSYAREIGGLPQGTHVFRVRTVYDDGRDPAYSDEVTTEVRTPTLNAFSVRPNPASGTTVLVGVKESQNVEVTVYDAGGRLVRELFNGRVEAGGDLRVEFGPGLPAGIYFIRAKSLAFDDVRKFALVR